MNVYGHTRDRVPLVFWVPQEMLCNTRVEYCPLLRTIFVEEVSVGWHDFQPCVFPNDEEASTC